MSNNRNGDTMTGKLPIAWFRSDGSVYARNKLGGFMMISASGGCFVCADLPSDVISLVPAWELDEARKVERESEAEAWASQVNAARDELQQLRDPKSPAALRNAAKVSEAQHVISEFIRNSLKNTAAHLREKAAILETAVEREVRIGKLAENGYEAWRKANGVDLDGQASPQWCDVRPVVEEHWLAWAREMESGDD